MTGPAGNNGFWFPENLNFPRGEDERNIEVEGKQRQKINCEETVCFTLTGSQICLSFKEYDLMSLSKCVPWMIVGLAESTAIVTINLCKLIVFIKLLISA